MGAGAVVRQPQPAAEDLRRHRRRGRLAVRRRDQRRPERQSSREPVDGARVDFPEQLAGNGRAPAGAGKTRKPARGTRERNLGGERNGHAHDRGRLSEPHWSLGWGNFRAVPRKGEEATRTALYVATDHLRLRGAGWVL